jgi:hypothetical protein
MYSPTRTFYVPKDTLLVSIITGISIPHKTHQKPVSQPTSGRLNSKQGKNNIGHYNTKQRIKKLSNCIDFIYKNPIFYL